MDNSLVYVLDGRTATPHFPGIGRYVSSLARAMQPQLLPEEKLGVLLNQDQTLLAGELEAAGASALIGDFGSPFSIQQQWRAPRFLRTFKASLYHSPYYLMPFRPQVPAVLTVYDAIPLLFPEQVSLQARLLFRWMTRIAMGAARHILAISGTTRSDYQKIFDLHPDKITAVPLAPGQHFQPQPREETARIRQKYGLPDRFVLYLGINKPHKNLIRLIESFTLASANQLEHTTLAMAGPWDPRYPQAKDLVSQKNIKEQVTFLGPIPEADLPGLYAAAAVFVFPSLYEGFGLPVLEAMACGTPVACADTSSLSEIADGAAELFDPYSQQSIAAAMARLLSRQSLRDDLRRRGLTRAAEYTWERTARATLAVYRGHL